MIRCLCFLISTILFLSFLGCQQPADKPQEPVPQAQPYAIALHSLHQQLTKSIAQSACPGAAVVIVKDTSVIYQKGFGTLSVEEDEPVNAETVFRLGSLSKGIAAALTARMIEQKYLDWDDRIVDILPDFQLRDSAQTARLTIAHLLSHTTGLPRHAYTNLIEAGLSLEQIWPRLQSVRLIGSEGEYHAYQNACFALIERILEVKSGCSFEQLLQEELFDPLGMHTASFSRQQMRAQDNFARPHKTLAAKVYTPTTLSNKYYNAISAGGVNASIRDMAAYLKLLLGQRPDLLRLATVQEMFEPFVHPPTRRRFDRWEGVNDAAYGMGWRVLDYQGRLIAYHSGFVNGYVSEIAIDLEHQIGICALFNAPVRVASEVIPLVWHQNLGACGQMEEWSGGAAAEKERDNHLQ